MGCITRKFRGYGFCAMMLQMPIVMVQRSKYVRGRTLLNNVLFWCSMVLGLSMVRSSFLLKSLILTSADVRAVRACVDSRYTSIWVVVCISSSLVYRRLRDTLLSLFGVPHIQ